MSGSESSGYETDSQSSQSSGSSGSSEDGVMNALDQWRAAADAHQQYMSAAAKPSVDRASALEIKDTNTIFEEQRHSQVLMINSLDRDQSVWPSPTQVRLKLPRPYRSIERIEIVQVKFFCGLYNLSAARKNSWIWVTDASGTRQVFVPDGTYTIGQLAPVLASALSVGTSVTYTVSFAATTGRITISATGAFSLPFQTTLPSQQRTAYSEWGLGWNLGFGPQPADLTGASSYTAVAWPRLVDDYIYLQMNETEHMNEVAHTDLEVTSQTQDSTGQVAHYFGKLLLNNFGCWAQSFIEAPKAFKPVLGKLERLSLTWTDRFGNVLSGPDAVSCDWHMTLRITEIVQVQRANSGLTQTPV
jgi:hypothetical protein